MAPLRLYLTLTPCLRVGARQTSPAPPSSWQGFDACSSFSQKIFAEANLFWEPYKGGVCEADGRSHLILASSSGRCRGIRSLLRCRDGGSKFHSFCLVSGATAFQIVQLPTMSPLRLHYKLGAFLRGEKALSWQRHGVALTTCELGNGALFAPFPDRSAVSTAQEGGLPKARRRGC